MKKMALLICTLWIAVAALGQTNRPFEGKIVNKQYDVYIRMNFYDNDIVVEGADLFGKLPGFFGDEKDARKWLFTKAKIKGDKIADLQIINDYGSEDLEATLELTKEGVYVLTRKSGSDMKIARDGKWVKIPKRLVFVRLSVDTKK